MLVHSGPLRISQSPLGAGPINANLDPCISEEKQKKPPQTADVASTLHPKQPRVDLYPPGLPLAHLFKILEVEETLVRLFPTPVDSSLICLFNRFTITLPFISTPSNSHSL